MFAHNPPPSTPLLKVIDSLYLWLSLTRPVVDTHTHTLASTSCRRVQPPAVPTPRLHHPPLSPPPHPAPESPSTLLSTFLTLLTYTFHRIAIRLTALRGHQLSKRPTAQDSVPACFTATLLHAYSSCTCNPPVRARLHTNPATVRTPARRPHTCKQQPPSTKAPRPHITANESPLCLIMSGGMRSRARTHIPRCTHAPMCCDRDRVHQGFAAQLRCSVIAPGDAALSTW